MCAGKGEEGDRLNGHTMVGVRHGRCCFVLRTALTYLLLVRPGFRRDVQDGGADGLVQR